MSDTGKHTLVSLTKGFIALLANSNGEVDLSDAENILHASKRRLYDVANVLAGVGLVARSGKSKVRWIGELTDNPDVANESKITEREAEIDAMIHEVDNCINDLTSSELFKNYAWVTEKEIYDIVNNEDVALYAFKGSPNLVVEYTPPDDPQGELKLLCKDPSSDVDLIPLKREKGV